MRASSRAPRYAHGFGGAGVPRPLSCVCATARGFVTGGAEGLIAYFKAGQSRREPFKVTPPLETLILKRLTPPLYPCPCPLLDGSI